MRPISLSTASRLIVTHHYSQSASNQAVAIHGLFHIADTFCVLPYGVCWWLPLPSPVAAKFFHTDWKNVLSLSRLVCTPDAPRNSVSFMLSRSIKLLPARYHTLATYADTWQGHTGGIYKASNWTYRGLTTDKPVWLDENGRMVSTRNGRNGTRTTVEMKDLGFEMIGRYAKHRFVYHRHDPQPDIIQLSFAI